MSFIHNRTGLALCAAAVAVVLLGAGCRESEAPAGGGAQSRVDAGDALPTRWAEYRSDTLGITIPYPEGWQTRTEQRDGILRFDADEGGLPPPEVASDASPALSIAIGSFDVEAIIPTYGPEARRTETTLDGRSVVRIDYETELGAESGEVNQFTVYLWVDEDRSFLVEGVSGASVTEQVARTLIAKGRGR
ncbi:MAG: hypothetical protein WC654_06400 [Patescibacteria group bacterium]